VRVGERHYVICRNLIEARRDAEVRETVLRSLRVSRRRQGAGSAEAPFDVISRPRTKCTSRSTTAGWRTTPNMMVSCPANQHHPEPARRHASISRAAQGGGHLQNDKIFSTPGRSIIKRMPQSAATSFARSWRSSCPSVWKTARRGAIAIEVRVGRLAHGSRPPPGNRKSKPSKRASTSSRAMSVAPSRPSASRCRPTSGRPTPSHQPTEQHLLAEQIDLIFGLRPVDRRPAVPVVCRRASCRCKSGRTLAVKLRSLASHKKN
jgi:hypothetical protein